MWNLNKSAFSSSDKIISFKSTLFKLNYADDLQTDS